MSLPWRSAEQEKYRVADEGGQPLAQENEEPVQGRRAADTSYPEGRIWKSTTRSVALVYQLAPRAAERRRVVYHRLIHRVYSENVSFHFNLANW